MELPLLCGISFVDHLFTSRAICTSQVGCHAHKHTAPHAKTLPKLGNVSPTPKPNAMEHAAPSLYCKSPRLGLIARSVPKGDSDPGGPNDTSKNHYTSEATH